MEKRIHDRTTKDPVENEANGTASVWRVLKVVKPDETQFPLQGRYAFGKDEPGLGEALGNHEPTLEDQNAKLPLVWPPCHGEDLGAWPDSRRMA